MIEDLVFLVLGILIGLALAIPVSRGRESHEPTTKVDDLKHLGRDT